MIKLTKYIGLVSLAVSLPVSLQATEAVKHPTVCEYIAKTATVVNANISAETVKGSNSAPFARDHLIQNVDWDGVTLGEDVWATGDVDYNIAAGAYYETHIRWTEKSGYLPYKGKWYTVFSEPDYGAIRGATATGAFLKSASSQAKLICAFDPKSTEQIRMTSQNHRLRYKKDVKHLDCDAAIDPKNKAIPNIALTSDQWKNLKVQFGEDLRDGQFRRNAYPATSRLTGSDDPVMRVDINNDGTNETLLAINYSEGSSYPCGLTYYDLISDDLSSVLRSDLREAILAAQDITRRENGNLQYACHRMNEIVQVNGRTAISSRRKLFRQVSVIEDSEARKFCTSTFTVEPVIVFDAEKQ